MTVTVAAELLDLGQLFRVDNLIDGVPLGCIYALVAVGLVLTYKTSGVFNLAFGAQAFLSAAIFFDTRTRHDWPLLPAFLLSVVVVGPLVGLILDRFLFRFLRTARWQVKLISALGLLVGLLQATLLWFGADPGLKPPAIAPDPDRIYELGGYRITQELLVTVLVTVAVVGLLGLLFRYTPIGLQMRALVESARMVELAGVDAERVGAVSWMLSSFLAGLAGVMLAPNFQTLEFGNFYILIVVAVTAAAFGRLSSIPLTLAGGIALGVAQQGLARSLDPSTALSRGLRPSLPFAVLFLLLLFWPGLRTRPEVSDPLSGVDPPAPALAVSYQDERLRRFTRFLLPVFLAVVFVSVLTWVPDLRVDNLNDAMVLTVLLLSFTVITGMSGQISLAQTTFAGVGGFVTGRLVDMHGVAPIPAMFVAAAVAAMVGGVLAIPALRLGGIYLALGTLAFALMAEQLLYPQEWLSGGTQGWEVPRPAIGPIDLGSDQAFFFFSFAVFALAGFIVVLVRKGTTGQSLAALRGSETAAASIGIDPVRARITVFALSAGIAGLGGGLYAMKIGQVSSDEQGYLFFLGVVYVVVIATLGTRTVDGALNAGIGFVFFPILLDNLAFDQQIAIIAFGFGALTYAQHPEGIVEFRKRTSIERVVRNGQVRERAEILRQQGRLPSQYHRALSDVALTAVSAGLYLLVFSFRGHAELRRHRGRGLPGLVGLLVAVPLVTGVLVAWRAPELLWLSLLLTAAGVTTLFLLPARLAQLAAQEDMSCPVTWRNGGFPAFFLLLTVFVQYRTTTGNEPTDLGINFVLVVTAVVVLVWVATVQSALNEYWVGQAEGRPVIEEAAPETVLESTALPVQPAGGGA